MNKGKRISAVVPWYGSNRTGAALVGRAMAGCEWVGVPFAGGMCELGHLTANTILVSDLHRHVLNLAQVIATPTKACAWPAPSAVGCLQRRRTGRGAATLLADAAIDGGDWWSVRDVLAGRGFEWADAYFVCAWMARNGTAGTRQEFTAGLSVRWSTRARRLGLARGRGAPRLAVGVPPLHVRLPRRVRFSPDAKDVEGHGLYCDPRSLGQATLFAPAWTRQSNAGWPTN